MATTAWSASVPSPASSFDDFVASRPEGERWEQIDGLFVMQATPTIVHAIIASNIERLLNDALARARPHLIACREVTIIMEQAGIVGGGNYVPDVAVLDESDIQAESSKAATYHLAVEIVSPSDRKPVVGRARSRIDLKMEGYQALPSCEAVLVVEQGNMHVVVLLRTGDNWSLSEFGSSEDTIVLPSFGFRCAVSEIYARTPILRTVPTTPRRL